MCKQSDIVVCGRGTEIKKKRKEKNQGLWSLLFRVWNLRRRWEMTHTVTSMIGQCSIL